MRQLGLTQVPGALTTLRAQVGWVWLTWVASAVTPRGARVTLLGFALVLGALNPPRAYADDWLAVLPGCSARAVSQPALELVYPRPGLPAVVEAGDSLLTRVRVPAALTPPPGVQQERALSGWSSELIGGGVVVGAARLPHRYSLPVMAIRPDTGSSLLYRVTIAVPAYVAPGSYGLRVRTPFGDREVERSVAVLVPGVAARVALLPKLQAGSLANLPVDVWLTAARADASAPAQDADSPPSAAGDDTPLQPLLTLEDNALALRVGRELWVSAACPADRAGFEAEVANVLRFEQRRALPLDRERLPPSAAKIPELESQALGVLAWQRTSHELVFDNRAGAIEQVATVLVPARSSIALSEAKFELYPAADLDRRRLAAIAIKLRIRAGARARLELGPPLAAEPLRLDPQAAESGVPTIVRVLGAPPDARVAFEYGFARSAFGGPALPVSFAGPLEEPLRALVLTPRGGARWAQGELRVSARRPPSCSAAAYPGRDSRSGWVGLLFSLVFLLKRRPRWDFGNRLRPALRWFRWWSWKNFRDSSYARSHSRPWPRASPR